MSFMKIAASVALSLFLVGGAAAGAGYLLSVGPATSDPDAHASRWLTVPGNGRECRPTVD